LEIKNIRKTGACEFMVKNKNIKNEILGLINLLLPLFILPLYFQWTHRYDKETLLDFYRLNFYLNRGRIVEKTFKIYFFNKFIYYIFVPAIIIIGVSALLIFIELFHYKKNTWKIFQGNPLKRVLLELAVIFVIFLFWPVAFPYYMYYRKKFGLNNLFSYAIIIVIIVVCILSVAFYQFYDVYFHLFNYNFNSGECGGYY